MESTIWFTDGFVVITGEIGSGKTTLIESFLRGAREGRRGRADQPDAGLGGRFPAVGAGAVRLLALQDEEGRAASRPSTSSWSSSTPPARKVLLIVDEAQNLSLTRARGDAPALRRRDHQGKGAAHHPGRPAGAQRQARRAGARSSSRSACACAFTWDALDEDMHAYIHHRLEVAGVAGPRDLRRGYLRADLPLHRRRAATGQHAVRHRHARGLQSATATR